MTTTTISSTDETATTESTVERLRGSTTAVRLSFTWLGVRKTLTPGQKDQAAGSFGAEGKFISAGKKLIDTTHASFRAVTKVKGEATKYWKDQTLPYPEPGMRLIRQSDVADFGRRVDRFKDELSFAVADLEDRYDELRNAARNRLGDLFNASDYPPTLVGAFGIECDFPNVEPPEYLRRLSPQLYEAECSRVQDRFNQAVALAEQAFSEELARLVDHLSNRLSGSEDGQPRIFRDSAVTNLTEFFERFGRLNIRSNEQLDELVTRARAVIGGVQPQQLRDSQNLRQHVSTQMASIQSSLDQLLVDRPRRRIQRRPR
jgi:hypothetical protein